MTRFCLLLILFLLSPTLSLPAAEVDPTAIVRAADARRYGDSSYVEVQMEIVRPSWTRRLQLRAWSKGDSLSLVQVLAPARERGTCSLKRGREMWNWIPQIARVIKIAPSMLTQSWMGSDFTNDDLINPSSLVVDYHHRLLREELFDGTLCWVIEAIPKEEAPVVWGRLEVWISQQAYNERRVAYYDETGMLINTLSTSEVRDLGGRLLPARLEMVPHGKEGQRTVLTYTRAAFDFPLADDFFSLQTVQGLP